MVRRPKARGLLVAPPRALPQAFGRNQRFFGDKRRFRPAELLLRGDPRRDHLELDPELLPREGVVLVEHDEVVAHVQHLEQHLRSSFVFRLEAIPGRDVLGKVRAVHLHERLRVPLAEGVLGLHGDGLSCADLEPLDGVLQHRPKLTVADDMLRGLPGLHHALAVFVEDGVAQ